MGPVGSMTDVGPHGIPMGTHSAWNRLARLNDARKILSSIPISPEEGSELRMLIERKIWEWQREERERP